MQIPRHAHWSSTSRTANPTPLLYEERKPDLDVNDRAIDAWFERITLGLTEDQITDLKKRFEGAQSWPGILGSSGTRDGRLGKP